MLEQTPRVIVPGLGQQPAPVLCPPCAHFSDGGCVWCPEEPDDTIPECVHCEGRVKQGPPWYLHSDFLIPLATTVVGTVFAAMLLAHLGYPGNSATR